MRERIFKFFAWVVLIVVFSACFPLSARRIAELDDYYQVPYVVVDKEQVYVWDQSLLKIVIYSRQGYKKIAEFGRRGQGPGEFIGISAVNVDGDYIYVSSFPKVCIFTKGGKLEEEIKGPSNAGGFIPCDGNYVGTLFLGDKHGEIKAKMLFALYDSDLEKITDLKEVDYEKSGFFKNGRDHRTRIGCQIKAEYYGEKIIIGEPYRGFFFSVFDKKGRKLYDIEKKVSVRKITEEDKKINLDLFRNEMGEIEWRKRTAMYDFYFPDVYPAFENFSVSNNRIYVFDYLRGEKRAVNIFDLKGNPTITVTLDDLLTNRSVENGRFSVYDGKLYYVLENQDEEQWELHEINLDGAMGK